MSSNADTLARVVLEIERILGEYLEPLPPNGTQDAKAAIEKFCWRWTATMRSERLNVCWMGI